MAEVDRVEVIQEDLGFGHVLFKLIGKILLLDLPLDAVLCRLVCPVGEDVVLDQLLGDRAGALGEIEAALDTYINGAENTGNIDSPMLVETLVLDRHKGVCEIFGDAALVYRDTVGIC